MPPPSFTPSMVAALLQLREDLSAGLAKVRARWVGRRPTAAAAERRVPVDAPPLRQPGVVVQPTRRAA